MRIPGLWPASPKQHGRIWTTTAVAQLVFRFVFLCIWTYLCLSLNVLSTNVLFGKLDLYIQESSVLKVVSRSRTLSYDGVVKDYFVSPHASEDTHPSMTLFSCSLILAVMNPKSFIAEAWVELCCHCLTIGIDIGTSSRLYAQDRPLSELTIFSVISVHCSACYRNFRRKPLPQLADRLTA